MRVLIKENRTQHRLWRRRDSKLVPSTSASGSGHCLDCSGQAALVSGRHVLVDDALAGG